MSAAGFGEAAAIGGLISLSIQLFDGCVKGFELLSAAKEFGTKGDILRCQLDWEHYNLNCWATLVGMFHNPPELNVSNPWLVKNTLVSLEQLLNDAQILKNDYGLDLVISEEELKEAQAPKSGFRRLLDKNDPQFVTDTAKVYSRRNSTWKKIKWASVDGEKMRLLLKDIRFFNENLRSVLHPMEQKYRAEESDILLRAMIAQSPDRTLLDTISGPLGISNTAIAASAILRHKAILLDLVSPSSSSAPSNPGSAPQSVSGQRVLSTTRIFNSLGQDWKGMRRDPDLLSGRQSGRSPLSVCRREKATYDGRPVILEWKDLDMTTEHKLKYRVARVAHLLAEMKDPAFHSLECMGFLNLPKTGRYAFLFQPPGHYGPDFVMRSLESIYDIPKLRPSVNARLKIAIVLTETVLQLHTVGWLHKGIRPDNVLFIAPSQTEWNNEMVIPPAFLGGYEYARADNPLETTEAPSELEPSQLYRHPSALGQGRASYNKSFDLYSLGCILLELGFWAPLRTIILARIRHRGSQAAVEGQMPAVSLPREALVPRDNAEQYLMMNQRQNLLQAEGANSIKSELEFRMGKAFSDIVMECLKAASETDGAKLVDSENSLEIQEKSLAALRRLADAI